MKLSDLTAYNPITVQCHDNPDADALASGYALYTYFKECGKDVRFLYAGRNTIQKPNLSLMLRHLEIPVEYVDRAEDLVKGMSGHRLSGLLVTVDCQYGAGNVTKIPAEHVAVIDHHQIEMQNMEMGEINPELGSCSTLVWDMLRKEHYEIRDKKLGTALYYGLYSDTNQFSEIYNPLDMDMRDALPCEKSLVKLFRNSNLSLHELEIAGVALIRHIYNDDYHYAIIRSQPCDPNILGLISDFLLQVAEVYTCVVYNEWEEGYKFSVRSCVREVQANELAAFLAEGVGSGGGHHEKAGGFISKLRYEEVYPTLHSEAFFSERLNDYFDNTQIIVSGEYEPDISGMESYVKKRLPLGYVRATDVLPAGTPITIRTLEGDVDMTVEPELVIMIGVKGEVYPNKKSNFEKNYELTEEPYRMADCAVKTVYQPTLHNRRDGSVLHLSDYAKICIANGETHIHAKELTGRVKVFTAWDREKYTVGKPGDYLVVLCSDRNDIYVVERDVFDKTYDKIPKPDSKKRDCGENS